MHKIVVVEDEEAIREMYMMSLKAAGYDVRGAEDGAQGLDVIEKFRPDMVLVDLNMPILSGQEMVKKLRNESWGKKIIILITTNFSQSQAELDLKALNIEKYIVKAYYTPKQLVEEIARIFENHQLTAQQ